MNKFKLAAVASAFALSFNAHADTFSFHGIEEGFGAGYSGTISYNTVPGIDPIDYDGSSVSKHIKGGVLAGAFSMRNDDTGLDFKAFCVDIFNTITTPVGYSAVTVADYFNGTTQANGTVFDPNGERYLIGLNNLFNNNYGSLSDNENYAAFQLALWELTHEYNKEDLNLTTGQFQISGWDAGVVGLAQGMLEGLYDDPNPESNFDYKIWTSLKSQNLLTWTPCDGQCDGGETEVPEPGPLALIGLGLLGLGFITRKSQSSNNNFAVSYA